MNMCGGTTEQIEVLLLAQDDESAMQEELIGTFRHFDASKARCFTFCRRTRTDSLERSKVR